jgi:hypothetical protein
MNQSRPLYVNLDVPKESIAVAYVAAEHYAEVGSLGTRQGDLDRLIRKLPSKSLPLVLVSEAGPVGTGAAEISSRKATSAGASPPR